jgi:NhaA family Na+:H+ antiporter
MKTLLRIIRNETFSAYLLIPVGLLAIILGSQIDSRFLETTHHIADWHFNLRGLTLDYILGFFFYSVGLQLRFEFKEGGLQDRKVLIVSSLAAALGMATPALIYFIFNKANGTPTTGWGATMATDLPFVLAMLVVLKKNNLKGFVLALATIDDIGSVIVLSILYKQHIQWGYLALLLGVLGIYLLVSYLLTSRLLLVLIFTVDLAIGHLTGIQTSLIAVLFGIATLKPRKASRDLPSELLRTIEPISAFLVIPIFVFISLFRHYGFSLSALGTRLVLTLVIARLIGKPLGIFLGITLGSLALRVKMPFSRGEAFLIGALGTLGLDVSLIFAQRDFTGLLQNRAILGILVTIPLAVLVSVLVWAVIPGAFPKQADNL